MAENTLCYGNNLEFLRNEILDESVDFVCLDPALSVIATFPRPSDHREPCPRD